MIYFTKVLSPVFFLLIFIGCAKDEPKGLSDADLIQAIIDTDRKIEVEMEALPSSAKSTMQENYLSAYYHIQSLKASMLGYEVSIAGKPGRLGKQSEIYFDIDGKKLDYSDYEEDFWKYDDREENRNLFGDKRDWECFSIEYPIIVTTPIGNTYTFEGEESIKDYYEAYEIDTDISVIYPINITDNYGELITVDSDERLKEIYKKCYGMEKALVKDKKCFSMVYPVNYQMPDGNLIEVSSEKDEDGWAAIKAWYDDNPDFDERPSLKYPLEITYRNKEGIETQIINSEDEMTVAKEECREIWGENYDHREEGSECFELVYPVSYLMPDSTTIEISADVKESWAEFKFWYDDNPDFDQRPFLQYPLEIIYRTEEGIETQIIESENEMIVAKEECREVENEEDEGHECYGYVYPITFILPDESTVEILGEDDVSGWGLIRRFYEENPSHEEEPDLQYPVEITVQGDMVFVFDSIEALEGFAEENCNGRD